MDPNRGRLRPFAAVAQSTPAGAAPLAFGLRGDVTRGDFARDVAATRAAIAEVGSGRWIVDTADRYLAAVALFALAESGSVAVLPPAGPPDPVDAVGDDAVGLLAEPETCDAPLVATPLDAAAGARSPRGADEPAAGGPARQRTWVEFRSSGTSGASQPFVKAMRHLEDEVRVLEARLGSGLPGTTQVFATASHRHIYGLLFGVLWPLASGRPFQREVLLHPRELLPRLAASPASVLVTTPVHLKRMAENADFASLRGSCLRVFSSGGPLDADVARAVASQLGCAPFEIFGSTETGGVAIRCRSEAPESEEWEAMPGVDVRARPEDGRAEVTSPFASVGEPQADGRTRSRMGDRIELRPSGRFVLLGRADRVVKIAEKRLSLPEMEGTLCDHPFVAEASLLVRELGREGRVHAVVALSPAGREELVREGSRVCRATLTAHLAKHYDRVFLPRAWRFVAALPRDGQDKVPQAALRALFDPPAANGGASAPHTLSETRAADALERRLEVPADLVHTAGHFPERPLVPGVVQLDWALRAAADWFDGPVTLQELTALKFPEPLAPGGRVTLRLERGRAEGAIRFRLFDGARVHLDGRASFAVEGGPRSAA